MDEGTCSRSQTERAFSLVGSNFALGRSTLVKINSSPFQFKFSKVAVAKIP
jgi:hypothetical protein